MRKYRTQSAGPAQRLENLGRQIHARGTAPGGEVLDRGLHAFVDADGRQGEEGAAQPQDAESENQRQNAHADAGREQADAERPGMRVDQPDADVAAQAKEDDAAEIDVTGITEHQIDVARQRDVERGKDQALAQFDVVADGGRDDEDRDHQRDDPEKGSAHQPRHHNAPRRVAKTPAGNAINTATNSANSMTSVQLTGTNGVTSPSSRPSAMPPINAPTGSPRPPRTVTRKLLS